MDDKRLTRRRFIQHMKNSSIALALGGLGFSCGSNSSFYPEEMDFTVEKAHHTPRRHPNIIIINADDLGYGDLGCYGGKSIHTPNIDSLANQGVRFTQFYSCDPVCTPSRAGLLTGRYPVRMRFCYPIYAKKSSLKWWVMEKYGQLGAMLGALDIATEKGPSGLHQHEITIAEALKVAGYKTGMVGKWHLGDYSADPKYNPRRHGFDFYFGVPHSNDMLPFPLYRNENELEAHIEEPDQANLTGLYTDEAVKFIESSAEKPFFLYFAHTFPHRPLYASEPFKNKSEGGTYGDTVEEIDWSVGQILSTLRKHNIDQNTMIIFTSDNGPWYQGSSGGLRGRKGQSWEGGQRIPFIVKWPNQVPRGSICDEPAMNIDLLPTCLNITGLTLPIDRIIDGRDITKLFKKPGSTSPHDQLFFYDIGELEGVRSGKWKYIRDINHYTWPMPVNKKRGKVSRHTRVDLPLLFNLEDDPDESYNVYNKYPEIGKKMEMMMINWENELEVNPLGLLNKPK